jgi:hypothetical protein
MPGTGIRSNPKTDHGWYSVVHCILLPVRFWNGYTSLERFTYTKEIFLFVKWSWLTDHSKTGAEIVWLKTIQKPDTNVSCIQISEFGH